MNKILLTLSLLVSILLCSCGDSHLAKEASLYKPFAVIVPEKYSGNLEAIPIRKFVYSEQGQTVKLFLGVINEDNPYFGDQAMLYIKSVLWDIDGTKITQSNFKYTFETAGHKKVSLQTVDLWDDTVRQNFDFYINAPHDIAIDFPYNGYNQVNPANTESLPLRWTLSGIDEWEDADCEVYASNNPEEIWQNLIAHVDCSSEVSLGGTLLGSKIIHTKDSSFTFYWVVRATINSEYVSTTYDTTEIAKFSTKITDTLSTVKLSYTYDKYHSSEITHTQISFIAANGDTLSSVIKNFSNQTIVEKIRPQSGIKIVVKSLNRSDYAPESLMVDLPEGTVLNLDTIHLKDAVRPQIEVAGIVNKQNKLVQFNLYDDGAEIKENTLSVYVNDKKIEYAYITPSLQFTLPDCSKGCKVFISAQDYAENSLPPFYWTIRNVSTVYDIKGPFLQDENVEQETTEDE